MINEIYKEIENNEFATNKSFKERFSKFVIYALRVIVALITVASIVTLKGFCFGGTSIENISLMSLYIVFISGTYFAIKNKVNKKILLVVFILLGLVLRLIWTFSLNNIPVSDFEVMYKAAININNNDYSSMKELGYIARFPHLTIIVLYFSKMITFFKENTYLALKMINVIVSTVSIVIMYNILNEIFNDYKRVVIGTFIIAIIPSSILYTAVYCGENIAILFFLISIYVFLRVMNKKNNEKLLILCGIMLFVGHLFRMVGQIIIISYIMFILIYYNKKIIDKIKCISYILISFVIPLILLSNILIACNITDQKLYNGSEPHITSFLRGSNIESYGKWNAEDAEFVMDNLNDTDFLEKSCKEKIIERYTKTNIFKLSEFIIVKVTMQWCFGDYDGAFWAQNNLDKENYKIDVYNQCKVWYQLFYVVILLMIFKGLFNKKEQSKNKLINLFYIIFCGYGCTFLILESQARYGFVIYWIFIVLAVVSVRDDENLDILTKKQKK